MKQLNTLVPPPIVALIIGIGMWVATQNLAFGKIDFPMRVPVAIGLLSAGLLLLFSGVMLFITEKTTINPLRPAQASTLITTGVFSISRNPIYLSDLLILAALALWLGNVINLMFLLVFFRYITHFQIRPEERALRKLFGENYAAYCTKVRRWL